MSGNPDHRVRAGESGRPGDGRADGQGHGGERALPRTRPLRPCVGGSPGEVPLPIHVAVQHDGNRKPPERRHGMPVYARIFEVRQLHDGVVRRASSTRLATSIEADCHAVCLSSATVSALRSSWRTRLVGSDYITPDIVAKVTGRARYAEDFRAEACCSRSLL